MFNEINSQYEYVEIDETYNGNKEKVMRNKDMNAIELMNEEHKNILRIIKVVRKVCYQHIEGYRN